jgi:hypothetical protein
LALTGLTLGRWRGFGAGGRLSRRDGRLGLNRERRSLLRRRFMRGQLNCKRSDCGRH